MSDENAPEFHDRFSIHPDSAEECREFLMGMARRSGILGAEEEIETLSDWECVQKVETFTRNIVALKGSVQAFTRAAKGMAARFAQLNEALMPLAAESAACELEAFLAVDHS